jgi:hypothetical protein
LFIFLLLEQFFEGAYLFAPQLRARIHVNAESGGLPVRRLQVIERRLLFPNYLQTD